jgi:hypothetical protein
VRSACLLDLEVSGADRSAVGGRGTASTFTERISPPPRSVQRSSRISRCALASGLSGDDAELGIVRCRTPGTRGLIRGGRHEEEMGLSPNSPACDLSDMDRTCRRRRCHRRPGRASLRQTCRRAQLSSAPLAWWAIERNPTVSSKHPSGPCAGTLLGTRDALSAGRWREVVIRRPRRAHPSR